MTKYKEQIASTTEELPGKEKKKNSSTAIK